MPYDPVAQHGVAPGGWRHRLTPRPLGVKMIGDQDMINGDTLLQAGFLSRETEEFSRLVLEQQAEYFSLFAETNSLAHRLLTSLEFDTAEVRKLYAACLYGRLLESCQAVVVLAMRGFEQDTATLVRVALEAYLRLRVACTKPGATQRIVDSDILERLNLVNDSLQGWAGALTPAQRENLQARRTELLRERVERGARRISAQEIAREANELGLYHTVYRLTSKYVHLSPRALDAYIVKRVDGEPTGLQFGPSGRLVQIHVHAVSEFLLRAIIVLMGLFSIEVWPEITVAMDELRNLHPEWPRENMNEVDEVPI